MKVLAIIGFIGWAALVALLMGMHRPLPHRQEFEVALYRQGNNSDRHHCPAGTVPYYVDADVGERVFLECMR